jgi:hypothetical protein
MTCADTAERHPTWDDDPRRAIGREIEWELRYNRFRTEDRGQRFRDELVAIAALIEAHREEFDSAVAATGQRREWLEKKAARLK